jgi:hypothetical protein
MRSLLRGLGAKLKILIVRELLLERLLAIIKRSHSILHLSVKLSGLAGDPPGCICEPPNRCRRQP